jgi:hypothetical protein
MTLKSLLHCSAIIIEKVKVGDIRSVTLNIFQRDLVCCKELSFISDVGEMTSVSGIKDASEGLWCIRRVECGALPQILAGSFDCDMSGLVEKGIRLSSLVVQDGDFEEIFASCFI